MHIYVLGPKLLQCNILQFLSAIYTKSCAQTFTPTFGLFEIFDRKFAILMAPPSDKNENYVVHLKEQSLLKKGWKPRRNRPINGNAMLVWTMHPLNEQCTGPGAWQKTKKNIQTPCFCTYSGRALYDLPPPNSSRPSKRCYLFFDPTHSFSFLQSAWKNSA